jgi:ABC-type transport system involved in multi-copper enzyme maturation permease subunit
MDGRWGLGPVFASEWQTGSRSPRVYAIRAGFVLTLLAVLVCLWFSGGDQNSHETLRDFAEMGTSFFFGLVGTQLALVMLAAPAATAGAICLDRSRGTLTHLLVTDLSDPEIVLGKLAARLVPTLGLVLCALPVQYLASLLGGIDPLALLGSTVVAMGVAIFACSLALTFSVWGRKTQEVLLATYAVLLVWLLAYPMASAFGLDGDWPWKLDPFQLAMAPYSTEPASVGWFDYMVFFGVMIAASSVLVAVSVKKFRGVAAKGDRTARTKVRREWRWLRKFRPKLDTDPILWREWHRARPSRWSRSIWWTYYALAALFGVVTVERTIRTGLVDEMAIYVLALGSSIGLLLLSVDSATSLAEERARGSLDVLMTTPLTTRSIVWGKWRAAYRRVFSLTMMPTLVTLLSIEGWNKWLGASMVMGLMLAYGAAITSLGLALATWIPRLGRAVALCIGIYVVVTGGILLLCATALVPDNRGEDFAAGSPFLGPVYPLLALEMNVGNDDSALVVSFWISFYTLSAASLLVATLVTFDRSLGRARVRQRVPASRKLGLIAPSPFENAGASPTLRKTSPSLDLPHRSSESVA